MNRTPVCLVILAGLWVAPEVAAQGATGVIVGQVTDVQAGQPIAAVQVVIPSLEVGALTDARGAYRIPNVPAGTHVIAVERLGYESARQEVSVRPGATVTVDFRIAQTAISLDEIVVTGTAGGQQRREIGNVIGSIDASIAELAPVANTSDLLRGREAGVVLHLGGGSPGTASTIRIRGQGSMSGTNQPIVFVDGVRVNDRMSTPQGGNADIAISRIDDFSPHEIERVEIIKGPAAATLYGTEAAGGVIQIFTKRGAFDQPAQWNAMVRQGVNWFANAEERTPTNYGINPTTGEVEGWNPVRAERERGTPMFDLGHLQEYAIDVSGGAGRMRYFVSGAGLHADGVQQASWQKRYNFRTNVTSAPSESLNLTANAGFVLSRVGVPGRQSGLDFYRSAIQGSPALLGGPRRGFRIAPPEVYHERTNLSQESQRMTAGLTVNHEPAEWFTHRLTVGLDATDQKNIDFRPHLSPFAAQFFSAREARGRKDVRQESVLLTSFDYGATVERSLSESLLSSTSAGLQVNTKRIAFTRAVGEEFPAPGVESVGGAARTFSDEDVIENNTVGVYVQQQFGWRDRLFLVGALRADDNSAFGDEFSLVYYPKLSGSWVVTDRAQGWLNSLRLRVAYGESGQQPDVFDAIRTYIPRAQPNGKPAVFPSAPGNAALGPERGQEIEAGFDAALLGDRLSVEFTYYDKVMKDAIIARDVAPSLGFTDRQFVNLGRVSNKGVELALGARLLERQALDWDLDLLLGTNENLVEELGIDGHIQLGWTTRAVEGYPIGGYWGLKVLSAEVDAQGDILSMLCDDGQGGSIDCNDAPQVFAGGQDPKVDGSLTSTFTLFDQIRVHVMSDFKLGQYIMNNLAWDRYAAFGVARELWFPQGVDPKVLASARIGAFADSHLWMTKAGYWKLREIGVSAPIPAAWAARIGASGGQLNVAAQNLAMLWTDFPYYPETDPEVRAPARVLDASTREAQMDAIVPPLTSIEMSVRFTF